MFKTTVMILSGLCLTVSCSKINSTSANAKPGYSVYSGVSFQYFDQKDRVEVVKDLLDSIDKDYALLPIKKLTIGLDFEKLKEETIQAELEVPSIEIEDVKRNDSFELKRIEYLQAKSNVEFNDRVLKLIAKFRDTHFHIRTTVPMPNVFTPIRFERIDGKVVVRAIDKKFLALSNYQAPMGQVEIEVGDEVLEIDGENVEVKVNQLKEFIGGSTESYRDLSAVRALAVRKFSYPETAFLKVKFKNAGTVKLPFIKGEMGDLKRRDVDTLLENRGIKASNFILDNIYDSNKNEWKNDSYYYSGYNSAALPTKVRDVKVYLDDEKEAGLKTGYYIKNGKAFAVIQLLTFDTENLAINEKSEKFIKVIYNFIKEAKEANADIIFDLRNNGGGNGNFPRQVMSGLTRLGDIYPDATRAFRSTAYFRQLVESSQSPTIYSAEQLGPWISLDLYDQFVSDTLKSRKEISKSLTREGITAAREVGGYEGKIVALITPRCISACDKMSMILKSSKRVKIIGTTSNGTGAGYRSSTHLDTDWTDRLRIFKTHFPNNLFGWPGDKLEAGTYEDEESGIRLNSENKPVVADIQYATSMKDLLENNEGWYSKAIEELEK